MLGGTGMALKAPDDYAWNMLVELRKEILSEQHLKNQTITFKVTLIGSAVGIVIAQDLDLMLLAIPTLAAAFFDLIIDSHVATIRRIGLYTRVHLEPVLRESAKWPVDQPMWEEWMDQPRPTVARSLLGNVGITFLVYGVAQVALIQEWRPWPGFPLSFLLGLAMLLDVYVVFFGRLHPGRAPR
jgi:hypothetical protein